MSLAQLAPTYQLTNLSVAQFRADYLGSGGGVPATALVSLVWPNYYHIFEPAQYKLPYDLTYMYLYCGILGLLFGLAGVVLAALVQVEPGVRHPAAVRRLSRPWATPPGWAEWL